MPESTQVRTSSVAGLIALRSLTYLRGTRVECCRVDPVRAPSTVLTATWVAPPR